MTGITVSPAATSQFQVAGFPLSVIPGSTNSFTVTAKDAYGNTTPAYVGTVKFSSSDLQAILPANYTFTSIDAGIHTFAATLSTVGVQSISVTDTVNAAITGMETGISVTQLIASISGSSIGVPGQSLSFTLGGSESACTIYSYSVQ